MFPLAINLAIIFGTRLIVANAMAIIVPLIQVDIKYREETKGTDGQLTPAEIDYNLLPYDPIFSNVAAYADTAVQYGYMVLFITALPCATFFSMVNSYFKLRIDALVLGNVSLDVVDLW